MILMPENKQKVASFSLFCRLFVNTGC